MLPSSYYLNVFVRSETIFAYNVTRTWVCLCIEQTYCLSLPCFKYIKKSQYLHEYTFISIYNLHIYTHVPKSWMSDILKIFLYEKGILNIYSFTQYRYYVEINTVRFINRWRHALNVLTWSSFLNSSSTSPYYMRTNERTWPYKQGTVSCNSTRITFTIYWIFLFKSFYYTHFRVKFYCRWFLSSKLIKK